MIEYPSIINSSKCPRANCLAFEKLDGSNFRAKWTQKRGFDLFGTRTQLIDENTEFWGEMVRIFKVCPADKLDQFFRKEKEFRNEREIIVFGEFFGENSFAGRHENESHKIVIFDVLVGHKNNLRKFLLPQDFIEKFQEIVEIPNVIYSGKLNEELIQSVRANTLGVGEGIICKGTERSGAFVGGVWMVKIKTNEYFEKLKKLHGDDWKKYWE